jgi:NAD(P)-dependent dehydrogenase (short-subunit alcohol dehydrogenase family)
MVDRTVERLGPLDVVVIEAVAGGHMPAPLADVGVEDFDSSYAVNLRGYFLATKYEIQAMLRTGGAQSPTFRLRRPTFRMTSAPPISRSSAY